MTRKFKPVDGQDNFIYYAHGPHNHDLRADLPALCDIVTNNEADRIARLLSAVCDDEVYSRSSTVYGLFNDTLSFPLAFLPDDVLDRGKDKVQIGMRMHIVNRVLMAAGYNAITINPWPALRPLLISPPHPLFGILGSGNGCRSRIAAIHQASVLDTLGHQPVQVFTDEPWKFKVDPIAIIRRADIDAQLEEDDEL